MIGKSGSVDRLVPARRTPADIRKARLADALRNNLRRRKDQARARDDDNTDVAARSTEPLPPRAPMR